MKSELSKNPALPPEICETNLRRRFKRIVQIAYLIIAVLLYSMMFGPKTNASSTARLVGYHSARAYDLTTRAPADASLKIQPLFSLPDGAKPEHLLKA